MIYALQVKTANNLWATRHLVTGKVKSQVLDLKQTYIDEVDSHIVVLATFFLRPFDLPVSFIWKD